MGRKAEISIELAAVVVAAAAMWVAVSQGKAQREHNRLSVKPALTFDTDELIDGTLVKIDLRNSGLGPATVKRFTLYIDAKPVPEKDGDIWASAEKVLNLSDPRIKFSNYYYNAGDVIATGERQPIIDIERDVYEKLSDGDKALWNQAMPRLKIEVDYTSFYGDEFNARYP